MVFFRVSAFPRGHVGSDAALHLWRFSLVFLTREEREAPL